MAKNDTKKGRKDKRGGATDAVEAVRSAVERTLQEGAGLTQKRTRELVDDIHAAAARIRESFEDLKVVDELRDVRAQVETLAARVAELERGGRARVAGAARSAAGRAPARSSAGRAPATPAAAPASKPAAKRRAATSSRAKKPAAKRRAATSTTTSAKKPAAKRRATAKRSAAKRAAAPKRSAAGSS
jgi:hypothetical protein